MNKQISKNNSNARIKLFAIAKDEAAYIPQWVFHHFYFGFDEIEIWLNNITDNSVEICTLLSKTLPNFSFKVVDDLLNEASSLNRHFQMHCYNTIYEQERNRQFLTHIIFLDLDEFWVPIDFSSRIQNFIAKYRQADSISFPWYFDEADQNRKPFDSNFKEHIKLFFDKDQHVKTLVKISDKVKKIDVHNHIISNGIQIDCEGNNLPINDENFMGAKLPFEINNLQQKSRPVDAFIYHTTCRSQEEYLSSLLRGRSHRSWKKENILKDNRWGYLNELGNIDFHIHKSELSTYNKKLNLFLKFFTNELSTSHRFVMDRYRSVVQIFDDYNNFERYKRLLLGINLAEINTIKEKSYSSLKFYFDRKIFTKGKSLELIGWLVFLNSGKKFNIEFYDVKKECVIVGELYSVDRPDVLEKVDSTAPLNSGFRFVGKLNVEIQSQEVKIKLLSFNKNTNMVRFGVEYK